MYKVYFRRYKDGPDEIYQTSYRDPLSAHSKAEELTRNGHYNVRVVNEKSD